MKRRNFSAPPHASTNQAGVTPAVCSHSAGAKTGSWTGPPGGKRAPRAGIRSAVFGAVISHTLLSFQSDLVSSIQSVDDDCFSPRKSAGNVTKFAGDKALALIAWKQVDF